jgi:hypothetical protein
LNSREQLELVRPDLSMMLARRILPRIENAEGQQTEWPRRGSPGINDHKVRFMANSEHYRGRAAEYKKRVKQTHIPDEIRELKRLERAFSEMAENEDWMERNSDQILHPPQRARGTEGTQRRRDGDSNGNIS